MPNPSLTTRVIQRPRAICSGIAPWTIHDIHAFLNGLVAQNYRTKQLDYAICLKSAPERVIGGIAVYGRSPENGRYEFGYILARSYWGQGLVPEARRRLLDAAFADPAVERIDIANFRGQCAQ